MPKTKRQGLVFGILMSVTMAYGMEVYNVALKSGVLQHVGGFSDMRNTVFLDALKEAAYMWVIVLVISTLWGNRLGAKLAVRLVSEQDSPFLQMLARSCCTVLVMCPTMSLVAAVLFQVILSHQPVGHVGRYCVEELSHGAALESVCSRTGEPGLAAADFCEKEL